MVVLLLEYYIGVRLERVPNKTKCNKITFKSCACVRTEDEWFVLMYNNIYYI